MDPVMLLAGALVSVVIQIAKSYFGTNNVWTLASVLILSLVVGGGFWFLQQDGLWGSFLQIAATAGAVYAFVFKTYQDNVVTPTQ